MAESRLASQSETYEKPDVPETLSTEKKLSNLRIKLFNLEPELDRTAYSEALSEYATLLETAQIDRDDDVLQLYTLYAKYSKAILENGYVITDGLSASDLTAYAKQINAFKTAEDWYVKNLAHLIHAVILMNTEDMVGALANALEAVKIIPDEDTIYVAEASYATNGLVSTIYSYSANLKFGINAAEIHIEQRNILGLEADTSMIFSNFAYALMHWREYVAAEKVAKSTYLMTKLAGKEKDGIVNYRYAQALNATKKYGIAERIASEGLSFAEPGLWTIHLESQRAIALAGLGHTERTKLSLQRIEQMLAEYPQYERWFDDRIRDVHTLLALVKNDAERVFDLMNETLVANTHYLLNQSTSETQKLLGTLENDKAVLKVREEKLELETQLANERADAAGKRSIFLLILFISAVIALIAVIRFAQHQKKVATENARLKVLAQSGELAKSQFLAVMSHELRTPLNGIIGLAEMLAQSGPTKDVRFKNNVILKSGLTLLDLLSNVLDVSQMETGKLNINPEPASIKDMIDNLESLWMTRARKKAIAFTLHVDPDVPDILEFDAMRLRQCIENLISNALKFTYQGRVHVHVTYTAREQHPKFSVPAELKIIVADTGKGMSPKEAESIFNAFTQADNTITREFGGSGLGLAITRKLARMMGGDVTLNTASGKGSEFTLTIHAKPLSQPLDQNADIKLYPLNPSTKETILRAEKTYADTQNLDSSSPGDKDLIDAKSQEPQPRTAQNQAVNHTNQSAGDELVEVLEFLSPAPDHNVSNEIELDPTAPTQPAAQTFQQDVFPLSLAKNLQHVEMDDITIDLDLSETKSGDNTDVHLDDVFSALLNDIPSSADLPARQPQTASDQTGSISSSLKETDPNSDLLRGLKILIADDIQANHDVLKIFLRPVGCRITSAMNGLEAVEAVKQENFDVILMDIRMPDMDGITATEIVKRMGGEASKIPIIAMTADASPQNNALCFKAGATVFLTKPLVASELFGSIRFAMSQKTDRAKQKDIKTA